MSYHFCSVETESIIFVTTQLRRDRKEMNLFLLVCNAEMEKCIASVYTQFGGGGELSSPFCSTKTETIESVLTHSV